MNNSDVLILDENRWRGQAIADLSQRLGLTAEPFQNKDDLIDNINDKAKIIFVASNNHWGHKLYQICKSINPLIRIVTYNYAYEGTPIGYDCESDVDAHIHWPDSKLEFRQNMLLAKYGIVETCTYAMWDGRGPDKRDASRFGRNGHIVNRQLTKRQAEILSLLSEGLSGKQIAQILKISPRTVELHRREAIAALGSKSICEAVKIFTQSWTVRCLSVY